MSTYAILYMSFVNDTPTGLTYFITSPPENGNMNANPATMNPYPQTGNTSLVTASSNRPLSGPGPEGVFYWQLAGVTPPQAFEVSFNHPYGGGTTWVTVVCPPGYVASGCGQGPSQTLALNNNCSSLQNHGDAKCTIVLSLA